MQTILGFHIWCPELFYGQVAGPHSLISRITVSTQPYVLDLSGRLSTSHLPLWALCTISIAAQASKEADESTASQTVHYELVRERHGVHGKTDYWEDVLALGNILAFWSLH